MRVNVLRGIVTKPCALCKFAESKFESLRPYIILLFLYSVKLVNFVTFAIHSVCISLFLFDATTV